MTIIWTYYVYHTSKVLLKVSSGNIKRICKICSKLHKRKMTRTSFWCFYWIWINFKNYSGLSVVNFEQVNACCGVYLREEIFFLGWNWKMQHYNVLIQQLQKWNKNLKYFRLISTVLGFAVICDNRPCRFILNWGLFIKMKMYGESHKGDKI